MPGPGRTERSKLVGVPPPNPHPKDISMAFQNRWRSRAMATGLMALLTVASGAALLAGVASARAMAADETPADTLKALKGTWVSEDPVESRWTFEGETLKASVNGVDYTCKVKPDPKAKPAALDFLIDEGPEDAKGKTSKCIYKLEGEKLILCVSLPGKERPKEFEINEGESYLFELKKEAAKAKDKDQDKEKVEKNKPADPKA
jgi:uncharacterized protein (TIGR03067 family)